MPKSVSHLRAIGYALTGFTLWVLTDAGIKLVAEAGLSPYEVIGFLGLVGAFFMLLKVMPRGAGSIRKLWPKRMGAQSGMALLALGCNLLNVVALKHLPLTIFYIVVFTAPMAIALLAALVLRERLHALKVVAIVTGFAGVVIAINPTDRHAIGDMVGYIAGFGSVLFLTMNMVWSRSMAQHEEIESLTFFNGLVQAGLCLAPAIFHFAPMTPKVFVILLIIGLLNVIANLAIFKALKYAAAAMVFQFHYTQLIAGALIGYLIWHEIPTLHLIIGAVFIIVSGVYIAAQARKMDKVPSVPI